MAKGGISDFVKSNAGTGGVLGAGLMAGELAGSESKLKGIASVLAQIITMKAGIAGLFIGTFGAAKKTMQDLVRESGSLDAALRKIGKAADDAGNAFAKAKEKMKAGAGGPWAEKEIQNTKNLTRAVEAMTPAVTQVSGAWAKLTGGLGTMKSQMFAAAAESGVLGKALSFVSYSIGMVSAAATFLATPVLIKWFSSLGSAALTSAAALRAEAAAMKATAELSAGAAAATASWASRLASLRATLLTVGGVLAKGLGIGLVISLLVTVAGMCYSAVNALNESAAAALRMANASAEASNALISQISNIKTATDQIGAHAAALDNLSKAYQQWLDVQAAGKDKNSQEYIAAANAKSAAEYYVRKAASAGPSEGAGSGTEGAVQQAEIRRTLERAGVQAEMDAASPEEKLRIMGRESGKSGGRAGLGEEETAKHGDTQKKLLALELERQETMSRGTPEHQRRAEEIARLENTSIREDPQKWSRLKALRDERDRETAVDPDSFERRKMGILSRGSVSDQADARIMELQRGPSTPGRQAEIDELAAIKSDQQALAGGAVQNRESEKSLAAGATVMSREIAQANILASIEEGISKSKEVGYMLSVKEREARIATAEATLKSVTPTSEAQKSAARATIARETREGTLADLAHGASGAESGISYAKSQVRGVGYGADMQKRGLEEAGLQGALQRARASGDPDAIASAEAALSEHKTGTREAAVGIAQTGIGLGMEVSRSGAQVRGDSTQMQRLDNFSVFKDKFDSLRGQIGEGPAAEVAGKLARDSITLKARDQFINSNSSVAADSLTRIGGGGNIGPGGMSAIDTAKQQLDLQKSSDAYLAKLVELASGKKGGMTIP